MNSTKIIVRYGETDQMGIVHHSNYYHWFEVGRTEFLKECGYPYSRVEKEGIFVPIIEAHCEYINMARYEDQLLIKTDLDYLEGIRARFSYQVIRESDNALIAKGYTMHTFLNLKLKPINPIKYCPDFYLVLKKVLNKN